MRIVLTKLDTEGQLTYVKAGGLIRKYTRDTQYAHVFRDLQDALSQSYDDESPMELGELSNA